LGIAAIDNEIQAGDNNNEHGYSGQGSDDDLEEMLQIAAGGGAFGQAGTEARAAYCCFGTAGCS
jgi:hypothetical protein